MGVSSAAVPQRMRESLREYEGFHQTVGNEVCHYVGIPSIIAGSATLLGLVHLATIGGFTLTLAEVIAAAIAVYYVTAARLLGLATSLLLVALVAVGRVLPFWVGLAVFVAGWIFQFIGHFAFEHRSPAFLKNLLHLLVGPAWIVERILKRLGGVEKPGLS
jgi:uncharacterized membrane protein YGL010W